MSIPESPKGSDPIGEELKAPDTTFVMARRRMPFDERASPLKKASNQGKLFLFSVLTLGFAALAGYMNLLMHFPLTDIRVVGPAIGALWFGLRVFMLVGPRP